MPILIDETLSFSSKEKDKITFGEKQSFSPNETTHTKYEFLPSASLMAGLSPSGLPQNVKQCNETLRVEAIEAFIKNIQTIYTPTNSTNKDKNNENRSGKIKKYKHTIKDKSITHDIRNFHEYEEKVRKLEQIKIRLGIDISIARRKNDNKAIDNINRELYYLRLDIEDAVYMRSCILNKVRKIPGYDKFANKKCKFFSKDTGCHDGVLCQYRH
jgi:hypothetical protein